MSVEKRLDKTETRIETVEDAIKLLSKLIANHDDRLYDSLKAKEDLNEKITMLIDAQIKTEDKLQQLTETITAAHQRLDRLES